MAAPGLRRPILIASPGKGSASSTLSRLRRSASRPGARSSRDGTPAPSASGTTSAPPSTRCPRFLREAFHRAGYRSASFGKQHYGGTKKAFQTEASIVLSEAVGYFKYLDP